MSPRPKTYTYNGKDMTVAQLANIRGCSITNMRQLISKHGFPEAMTATREAMLDRYTEQLEEGMRPASEVRTTSFNSKLERWRKLKSWVAQGMSVEEIMIKERLT